MRFIEITEAMKDYRSGWRKHNISQYDDDYYDLELNKMPGRNDNDPSIAYKYRPTAKPGKIARAEDIIPDDPNVIHRGMSTREYNNIMKHGVIQSNGSGNLGDEQVGLTYFTTNPSSADSYANMFSIKKPDPNNPPYIISIKMPSEDRIEHVAGTGEHEVGVKGPISVDDIVAVYKGNVIEYTPASKDIDTRGGRGAYDAQRYRNKEMGHSSSASVSRLHWEKIQ